jgi:hypothetical protein
MRRPPRRCGRRGPSCSTRDVGACARRARHASSARCKGRQATRAVAPQRRTAGQRSLPGVLRRSAHHAKHLGARSVLRHRLAASCARLRRRGEREKRPGRAARQGQGAAAVRGDGDAPQQRARLRRLHLLLSAAPSATS